MIAGNRTRSPKKKLSRLVVAEAGNLPANRPSRPRFRPKLVDGPGAGSSGSVPDAERTTPRAAGRTLAVHLPTVSASSLQPSSGVDAG